MIEVYSLLLKRFPAPVHFYSESLPTYGQMSFAEQEGFEPEESRAVR
jgi:hypothetical protein